MTNESFMCLILGFLSGALIIYIARPNPHKLIQKVYENYVRDMKHFATAYSELSVQFVNQHLPSAPPASFTQNLPYSNNRYDENGDPFVGAMQPDDDEADMRGGQLQL